MYDWKHKTKISHYNKTLEIWEENSDGKIRNFQKYNIVLN